ncbi:hypothetical protein TSTA_066280 [Talaromyces stipitatus ATCC 10500]|uniref:DUF7587 domain-containing protein n=1 Tax=Talaromyces stipitatus (strain ATCC 10500 / CBS 375.48 / QM 6759 / NRRL 1006) TaxID=441959 RepID=B8LX97_TALSN|nr:uncharacterized protein TSTA_066280 [Talaromyces stipitatus ATCC 10500]EED23177.1 hypothetical protein TSTA_066280 [Talaromyces stipitatus ATCC 10500]
MENNDILERFRTFDLPKLWTVTYPWRQASYAGNGDLVASDTTLKPQTEAELKQAVEHHLDWYNSGPSCFLSMFSDWRHCRNWASQRGDAGVYIIEVDITQLNHSYVFQAKHVTSELGILYSRSLEHEYFILHRIPRNAMKSRISLGEAEERDADIRYGKRRPFNPCLHWVDDLHGYYDTDEECEMHNANDDIMDLLEGDD